MRNLVYVGKLGPWLANNLDHDPADPLSSGTSEAVTACNNGMGPHEGPLLHTGRYTEFPKDGGLDWSNFGECGACKSTIHRGQLKGAAAA